MTKESRTPPSKIAKQLIKYLRPQRPDYNYLRDLFRHLRKELDISVTTTPKKLPLVPTEEEIKKYYEAVWQEKNTQHMVMIKTLLYTGIRVSELIRVKISDIDLERCQIRINKGKGGKDRIVPFPISFREILSMYITQIQEKKAVYFFESSWKKAYSDRGIRKILMKYTQAAGIESSVSPHKLRHFLLTWLKKQGIDDALIQPYSGHESRQSLEIYSRLSIQEAQKEYNENIGKFPV
ncbi:MAG: tyrosine-type recombinase/integrase [Alphaproteobacteria bacterium]|jgi:integrase/recombinase XerD|nr:tyrosine-type recombinase/integrase [Alphaproteobacteria bacterium]